MLNEQLNTSQIKKYLIYHVYLFLAFARPGFLRSTTRVSRVTRLARKKGMLLSLIITKEYDQK